MSQTPQNPPQKKPVVVLCMPGDRFSRRFIQFYTEAIMTMSDRYEVVVSSHYSSQVNFARALCLGADARRGHMQKPFDGKLPYDAIFWLDSDMVYSGEMICRLIDKCLTKKAIVSGAYAMEGGHQLACVEKWDEDFYLKNGCFHFITPKEAEEKIKVDPMVKCAYAGMGCMAIPYGIFEDDRLTYPWFFRDITKFDASDPSGNTIWEGMSEDVSFMRNLIESGVIDGVWVDLNIRFGHEKSTVF